MQVKNKKYKPSLQKRIKSESPPTTLLFVHSTKISKHNNTIKLPVFTVFNMYKE